MTRKPSGPTVHLQQVLLQDGSVFSVQWLDLPLDAVHRLSPTLLLERYYRLIRSFTRSLVRPATTASGVEFRLWRSQFSLLSFSPPLLKNLQEGEAVQLGISGGFLVQPNECSRGMLTLSLEPGAGKVRIKVQLSDYCPLLLGSTTPSRWRRLLYRLTQAYLHKVVTVRYLADLHREMTGVSLSARVEKVWERDGKNL